jgi:aminoglycoside phosphotransferase (APT) family kinase protein
MEDNTLVEDLSRLLEEPCLSLRRLKTGHSSSATYVAELAGRAVVVKVNDDASVLARTGHNLEMLAALGVPVPKLLAYADRSPGPGAVVVMELIAGVDLRHVIDELTADQLSVLARQIVDIQRSAAALPAPAGCGFVGIGERAARLWTDVVRRPNGYAAADPLPADAAHLVPWLSRAIQSAATYLDAVKPIAFLDDATTKNVMISGGRLTGIVDFDVICYGDPLFHVGLTAAAVTANAQRAAARHYVDELVRFSGLNDDQRRIVDLYEALFLTNFLTAESPHVPGPWRRRAIDGAERALSSAQR